MLMALSLATSDETLNLTTAAHWIGGSSLQGTSDYGFVYIDASGNILMHTNAPDESDTSGNTTGILRYNDIGGATDFRCIGWFFMNSTGAGELFSYEVSNLKDGDVHNSVVRTDSTQDTVDDTAYALNSSSTGDLSNTQVHFYSSGRGIVEITCHVFASTSGASNIMGLKLHDGSFIANSEDGARNVSDGTGMTAHHAESYAQGEVTFEAAAIVSGSTATIEEKTMIIKES
ncbi:hypothetical protein LCGC14_1392170 [marine sediment metagenome]|uniref:Uncharacterized protein n=1 Tax=marine sediment metagenome TaxID=412755 RepID=A0A0F9KKD7_9ZZZZ